MNLFEKYDIAGPRYTSYPPVPFWSTTPSQNQWVSFVKAHTELDLYIHIPFCEKLCWYCGCHRTITKNKNRADDYVDYIIKEWQLYIKLLGPEQIKINSIHFGGGTPTFLRPNTLKRLLSHFSPFLQSEFIGAIEVDPRTCHEDHLQVLSQFGFTRISMGIQDFDPKVQDAINRHQPFDLVEKLVDKIREFQFRSINFDLIYGLPRQNECTIATTITQVKKLNPDMIAFYSYAHLPDRLKNQRLINEADLPSGKDKRKLYEIGRDLLFKSGYLEIGLDHFAKEGSYLAIAKNERLLQRSFMGYTDKKTPLLIGLGVSAISSSNDCFIQNEKETSDYMRLLDEGNFPFCKGHVLSPKDKEVAKIINQLMCDGHAFVEKIISDGEKAQMRKELQEMQNDGLIEFDESEVRMTEQGHPFLRNVAMVFDFHLRNQQNQTRFSRTI
jgi:oxygen-independent coproporphyrinogen III oxidase